MCTLHTYCCKTGILHCYLLMLKGSMNISAPLPFLLCCIPIELPEQSCINKFWLILLLQFHAWHSLRYIQSKIKERKNICTNHFMKSHMHAISPSLLNWIGLLKWVCNPWIRQTLLCYSSVCEGESLELQWSCRAPWVQTLKAMSASACMCINKGYNVVGNGTTESCI